MPLRNALTLTGLCALLTACAGSGEYAALREGAANYQVNREALEQTLREYRARSKTYTVIIDGEQQRVRVPRD